jgi:hypothetical protein
MDEVGLKEMKILFFLFPVRTRVSAARKTLPYEAC